MAKPGTVPTWATDSTFNAPGDDWDGDNTRVAPSAGEQAQGFEPTQIPPAEYHNWLFGLLCDWATWLDTHWDSSDNHTYPTPKSRSISVGAARGITDAAIGGWTVQVDSLTSNANTAALAFEVAGLVPDGATLTGVDVMVTPGAARAGANRISIRVEKSALNWTTPAHTPTALAGATYDDGTTNLQVISISGLSETIDRLSTSAGEIIQILLNAGNDAGTNTDMIWGFRLHFTDPGLSNV